MRPDCHRIDDFKPFSLNEVAKPDGAFAPPGSRERY
jgi:hypothetical protein